MLGLGLDLFSVWCKSTREIAKVVDRIGGVLKSRGSAVDVSCMSKEKKRRAVTCPTRGVASLACV